MPRSTRTPGGSADASHRDAVFTEMGTEKMVRAGDWKYVYDPGAGRRSLFDLDADPDGGDDRADDPAVADRREDLHDRLLEWMIGTQERPNS